MEVIQHHLGEDFKSANGHSNLNRACNENDTTMVSMVPKIRQEMVLVCASELIGILQNGFRLLVTGYWFQVASFGSWFLVASYWSLVVGDWLFRLYVVTGIIN